jgi:hypothetical protein
MNIQTLLKTALGLSILATSYADAAPLETYKAAVIADCSNSHSCPLIGGDILWNDEKSRSALPLQNGMLFLGINTRVKIVNLANTAQEFSLLRGTLGLRVWKNSLTQKFKIRAGNLIISMKEAGFYQIEVAPNGRTTIQVISGRSEVRMGKFIKILKTGQSFMFADNRYSKYAVIRMPAYDDQYYFALNFIRSYYRMYPVDAPSADLIPQNVNGPRVEIIYYPPVTIYSKPFKIYHKPVIVRESRFKSKPTINVDINLDKTFGGKAMPQSMPKAVAPATIEQEHPLNVKPRQETPKPEMPKPESPAPKAPKPEVPAPQKPTPEMPGKEIPGPEVPAPPKTPEPEVPAPKTPEPEAPVPQSTPERDEEGIEITPEPADHSF